MILESAITLTGGFVSSSLYIFHYNTTSSVDPWNVFADKYSEFSSDREYFGYSKNSRDKPNSIRNSHGPYSIACSIDFFIEEERKHYKLLDTYVFDTLSKIQLDLLDPHYKENDVFPIYDNIPINAYYKRFLIIETILIA
jgi:hypothetical protein